MDCCRERYSGTLNLPDDAFDFDAVDTGTALFGLRRKVLPAGGGERINGRIRGVFSATLLQALEDAPNPTAALPLRR